MHRAWLYLLHAEFRRDGIDFHYRDEAGKYRMVGGEPKAWELAHCLQRRFPDLNDPVRRNIEIFIALRNKMEHRFERALQVTTGGKAHALALNFEAERVSAFGPAYSLADQLRFPVFLQSITDTGTAEIQRQTRKLPKRTSAFIAQFESDLDPKVVQDQRYDFRVRLVPILGPKSDADLAVNFVDLSKLTEDEREILVNAGREGHVITKMKHVEVASLDKLLPSQVVSLVQAELPFRFTINLHTDMWKKLKVRPARGAKDPRLTDARYCLYDEPFRSYVYTRAWVAKIINEIGTVEKFTKFFGYGPQRVYAPASP